MCGLVLWNYGAGRYWAHAGGGHRCLVTMEGSPQAENKALRREEKADWKGRRGCQVVHVQRLVARTTARVREAVTLPDPSRLTARFKPLCSHEPDTCAGNRKDLAGAKGTPIPYRPPGITVTFRAPWSTTSRSPSVLNDTELGRRSPSMLHVVHAIIGRGERRLRHETPEVKTIFETAVTAHSAGAKAHGRSRVAYARALLHLDRMMLNWPKMKVAH